MNKVNVNEMIEGFSKRTEQNTLDFLYAMNQAQKADVYEAALKKAERELNAHPDIHAGRAEALRIIRDALGMKQNQQQEPTAEYEEARADYVNEIIRRLKYSELESYGVYRFFGGRFYEYEHEVSEEHVRRMIESLFHAAY